MHESQGAFFETNFFAEVPYKVPETYFFETHFFVEVPCGTFSSLQNAFP